MRPSIRPVASTVGLGTLLCTTVLALASQVGCGPGGGDDGGSCTANLLPGDLVISEVMADFAGANGNSGADEGKEWFEIYNASSDEIDLSGLTITLSKPDGTGGKSHTIASGTIASHGYFVLGNAAPDLLPTYVNYGYGNDLGSMSNSGGKLAITCGSAEADAAIFTDVTSGNSRELDGHSAPDYTANDTLTNWCSAPDTSTEFDPANFGTPGAANDPCTIIVVGQCTDGGTMRTAVTPSMANLTLTEWMPNPSLVDDTKGEWFEVTATAPVDLNGLQAGTASLGTASVIAGADCVHLEAGQSAIFAHDLVAAENGMLPTPAGQFSGALANTSGSLQLGAAGETFQTVTWTSTAAGKSIQVDPAGSQCTAPAATTAYNGTDVGTPGAVNPTCDGTVSTTTCLDGTVPRDIVSPTADQLTITEWMANPHGTDTGHEWFEVKATADVDLNSLQAGTTTLGAAPLIGGGPVACVHLLAGASAVFAQKPLPADNGGLPSNVGLFGFTLGNASGSLRIGVGGTELDAVTWTNAPDSKSIQIDTTGVQCTAPAAVTTYNGTDVGTPAAANDTACGGGGGGVTADMCLGDGGVARSIVVPAAGQLVINEWMADPTGNDSAGATLSDSNAEWFELRATAAIDLNGLVAGSTTLGTTPIIPGGAVNCVHLEAGDLALFARNADAVLNGGLPALTATAAVTLTNSAGTLQIGFGTTSLQTVTWATAAAGTSIMFDTDGTQCTAPAAVAVYAGSNHGTPMAANSPPECP